MKLLIITQKVDISDDNLGFFHRWLEKFSKNLEKLYVICLWRGEYNLPKNVIVRSMGKEKGISKIGQLVRLQKNLIEILPEIDGIFVHMCPIYAIASFPLVKVFGKKMILWFTYGTVSWELKLAERFIDEILTASEKSCRLKNRRRIKVLGHGIDVDLFRPSISIQSSSKFRISSIGRIAPVKNLETLIGAVNILVNQKNIEDIQIKIIGSPLLDSEENYLEKLKSSVQEKKLQNYIEFLGGVAYFEMPKHYQESDLIVNLSQTGSVDKVVLEAMASGCLILTCNEAFVDILETRYLFGKKNPQDLAEKIINLRRAKKDEGLRKIVVEKHNLDNLIDKIILKFQ